MKKRGIGIAAIHYPTGMNQGGDPSMALVKLQPDGSVDLLMGTVDLGQGAKTVMAQICAETLGVPVESVTVRNEDTDYGTLCTGTFASRATHMAGNAVIAAAAEARQQLLEVAGELLEVSPADLEIRDGVIQVRGAPGRNISVTNACLAANWGMGKLIAGRGAYRYPASQPDPETGACDPSPTLAYAATVAEVEVDTETGWVEVKRLVSAYDVGKAINPLMVQGQVEGGAVMGVGHALLENLSPAYPSLDPQALGFDQYMLPTCADVPELETVILETPSATGPFGAKGVGEMTLNAIWPAIANAVYDAVGVWITDTPITPEKLLRALEAD